MRPLPNKAPPRGSPKAGVSRTASVNASGTGPFPIVGIGASAGGLDAITHLVENLPLRCGVGYVVVQHLDPSHKSLLTELVSRGTTLPIQEVRRRTRVERDHIYVIPPNKGLYLERGELFLCPRNRLRGGELPIDHFFRTLAQDQPGNCIGVILSGTGSDGALGVEEIKATGGITFAQDEESAKYDGMPRAAIATGHIDYVLPPRAIAREIKRIAGHPYTRQERRVAEQSQQPHIDRIFALLKSRTAVDFQHYKQSTTRRRIYRRMALLKVETPEEYLKLLGTQQAEVNALYQDLLIKVTCFFREPESFQILHERVFPAMLRNRARQDTIRLWVPACSTGEEVYSLAISLLEYMGKRRVSVPVQIFGTDVSETALERARSGSYIENISMDVSPERLRRWFVRGDRGYQIAKDIREMCVFARQNVISDPPFSRLDLISCRNLLIYFDEVFQSRVLPVFHYALRGGGHLMLGRSESVGGHVDFFDSIDTKAKIYVKKPGATGGGISFQVTRRGPSQGIPSMLRHPQRPSDIQDEADRFIVNRFAPSGVVVDGDLKIIQFRGSTGEYLEPAPGRAAFHLLKMARGNLALELRAMLQKARSGGKAVREEGVRFQPKRGIARSLSLEVAPLRSAAAAPLHFLVLFEEALPAMAPGETAVAAPEAFSGEKGGDVRRELASTRAHLQSVIQEAETASEELKSANEEIMSSNEELQSTNEELETAKEELQSANEELTTVNEEVQTRNTELNRLNNDLQNFFSSVNIPLIMLGTDLRVRRFTPVTQKILDIAPADVGRPFTEIKSKIRVPGLGHLIAGVIDSVVTHEQEVQDDQGRYYSMSIRPYRTPANEIDGAVLVFADIDSVKIGALQSEEAKRYAESILEGAIDPLLVLDETFVVRGANSAYYRLFGAEKRAEGHSLFTLRRGQWNKEEIRRFLRASLTRSVDSIEIQTLSTRLGRRHIEAQVRRVVRKGAPTLLLLTLADVTARKKSEKEKTAQKEMLSQQEKALFEEIVRQVPIGVAIFDAPDGKLILSNERLRTLFGKKLPAAASIGSFRKIQALHPRQNPNQEWEWPMLRSLTKAEVVEGEEITLSGKESRVLHVSSSPVHYGGKLTAVVALFLDLTERKRIEGQIVEISGREQRRIAHDLHDGVGQDMAAIAYRIRALEGTASRQGVQAAETKEIRRLIEGVLSRTRDLAKFLQPVAMDSRGLMESLREMARVTTKLYRLDCVFEGDRSVSVSNQDVAYNAFRIAQEAVHNAVRHGKPKRIVIGLRKQGRRIELSVANDGRDFIARKRGSEGMGLHIMSYRAGLIGAALFVRTRRPRGTVVKFAFEPKFKNGR